MKIESLGFDRYQRFKAAAEMVAEVAEDRRLSILDIGSFDQLFAEFVPHHIVNSWEEHIGIEKGGVPLADNSVDMVVALDVLEHVPLSDRRFFIEEAARVSKRWVLLAFPVVQASKAESFVLEVTGSVWLAEHAVHGLPDPVEVEVILEELGLRYVRRPNGSLPSWTAMMILMHGLQDLELRERLCTFFNSEYYPLENREPAYRYIYMCTKKALENRPISYLTMGD